MSGQNFGNQTACTFEAGDRASRFASFSNLVDVQNTTFPPIAPRQDQPARRLEPSLPPTAKMQTYSILGRKVGSHYVSRALPIAPGTKRTTIPIETGGSH